MPRELGLLESEDNDQIYVICGEDPNMAEKIETNDRIELETLNSNCKKTNKTKREKARPTFSVDSLKRKSKKVKYNIFV